MASKHFPNCSYQMYNPSPAAGTDLAFQTFSEETGDESRSEELVGS